VIPLTEFGFPDFAEIPYPQASQGHYFDADARYFYYESKEDFDEIQEVIETMKDESNEKMTIYETMDTGMKEKAVFVITLPQETILANNLEKLGFKQIAEFHRRNCYFHEDMLKMWFLSWE